MLAKPRRLWSPYGMQALEALLRRYAKRQDAHSWAGPRPDVRDGQMARTIARQVGLPTADNDPFAGDWMVPLDRAGAAHVLAVAGTTSLAYGTFSPSIGALREAAAALADLGDDAVFLSNGVWRAGAPGMWNPLTTATFDCGLIGFDRAAAFIFWAEEED